MANPIASFIDGVKLFFVPITAGGVMALYADKIVPIFLPILYWLIPPTLRGPTFRQEVIQIASRLGELFFVIGLLILVLWGGVAFISLAHTLGAEQAD